MKNFIALVIMLIVAISISPSDLHAGTDDHFAQITDHFDIQPDAVFDAPEIQDLVPENHCAMSATYLISETSFERLLSSKTLLFTTARRNGTEFNNSKTKDTRRQSSSNQWQNVPIDPGLISQSRQHHDKRNSTDNLVQTYSRQWQNVPIDPGLTNQSRKGQTFAVPWCGFFHV